MVQAIFPGVAMAGGVIQVMLGLSQLYVYFKAGYERSRHVASFCLVSSFFSFHQYIIQSRIYSEEVALLWSLFIVLIISVARYHYIVSMSFFVAIPNKKMNFYLVTNFILGVFGTFPMLSKLVGGPNFLFDPSARTSMGNYFCDSFLLVVGPPRIYGVLLLSLYGFLDMYYSFYLIKRVRRSSSDRWFVAGLSSTAVAAIVENIILPISIAHYIPLYFLANVFEAARMSFLSTKEYILETELRGSQLQPVRPLQSVGEAVPVPKYQNMNLTDEKVAALTVRTRDVLETLKLYHDSNLRLEKLAHYVGVPGYLLSQVINNGMNTTFNDLINKYRIADVQRKLRDERYQDQNIVDIAYETGFNSKSTFYTTFKKISGQTPAEYRRSARKKS